MIMSLFVSEFARTGWLAYPPLSGPSTTRRRHGLLPVVVAGGGRRHDVSGNLIVTIDEMRCPGMTMMKMPVFTGRRCALTVLIVATFPILTSTLTLLTSTARGNELLHRRLGGNPMMYVSLIWIWGHESPRAAFGIFSESSRPSRASACSAIPRWSTPRCASPSCLSGVAASLPSPWGRARASARSSASPR